MDNCSIHKSDELEALIIAAGASLIYLPPYSPFKGRLLGFR
ncbi:transposase [Nostoc sp. EspVER01]